MSITVVSSFAKPMLLPPSPGDGTADSRAVDATTGADLDFASVLLGLPPATAAPPVGDQAYADAEAGSTLGEADPPLAAAQFLAALGPTQPVPATAIALAEGSAQASISLPASSAALRASQPSGQTQAGSTTEPAELAARSSRDERWPSALTAQTADGKAAKFAVAVADVAVQTAGRSDAKTPRQPLSPASSLATLAAGNQFPAAQAAHALETSLNLQTALRDPSWASELGQKLLWFVGHDKQLAQLTLNPPQLGSLEITLKLDKDGANAHFVSANADVRGAIETALPRLREMFATAGIELGQVSVGSESFRQQADGRQEQSGSPREMGDKAILGVASAGSLVAPTGATHAGSSLVDTFA